MISLWDSYYATAGTNLRASLNQKEAGDTYRKTTAALYNLETDTINMIRYLDSLDDAHPDKWKVLNELATLYLVPFEGNIINKERALLLFYVSGSSHGMVDLEKTYAVWTTSYDLNGEEKPLENMLHISQFLYGASRLMNVLADFPDKTEAMQRFLSKSAVILNDHYARWIFGQNYFYRKDMGCSDQGGGLGTYNMKDFVKKLDEFDEGLCQVIKDVDLLIIGGVAEMLGAQHKNPVFPITGEKEGAYLDFLDDAYGLIQRKLSEVDIPEKGKKGLVLDQDLWKSHGDFTYSDFEAAYSSSTPGDPPAVSEARAQGVSLDISHSMRLVHVFDSMYRYRYLVGRDFPNDQTLRQMANLFAYRVYENKNGKPAFRNFMDGSNGWYRVSFQADGSTYQTATPSYQLGFAGLIGGYSFWKEHNGDLATIMQDAWDSVKNTGSSEYLTHYVCSGGQWKDGAKFHYPTVQNPNAYSLHSLQFLPSHVANLQPQKPQLLEPADKYKVSLNPTLKWMSAYSWNDGVTYDVYKGADAASLVRIAQDLTVPELSLQGLPYCSTFYLRIEAKHAGGTVSSDLISLSTIQEPGADLILGSFDTPVDNAQVSGSIAVTGWAAAKSGIGGIQIFKSVNGLESYVGQAVQVEGARPDLVQNVEAIPPCFPDRERAGWGYMMLTNSLSDGVYRLIAKAVDKQGNQRILGSKQITIKNSGAVLPFGAIDTPGQGGIASGDHFRVQGWVLSPENGIRGGSVKLRIRKAFTSNSFDEYTVNYGVYRNDIATKFPNYADASWAGGYYDLDTTRYANGLYEMHWQVFDDANPSHHAGIGSRYFEIRNFTAGKSAVTNYADGGSLSTSAPTFQWNSPAEAVGHFLIVSRCPIPPEAGATLTYSDADIRYRNVEPLSPSITEMTVDNVSLNGNPVYVQLKTLMQSDAGLTEHAASLMLNTGSISELVYPKPGRTLQGDQQTFIWEPGLNIDSYKLEVGASPGAGDYFSAETTGSQVLAQNLPADGGPLYVRLSSKLNGVWNATDYLYMAHRQEAGLYEFTLFKNIGDMPGGEQRTRVWGRHGVTDSVSGEDTVAVGRSSDGAVADRFTGFRWEAGQYVALPRIFGAQSSQNSYAAGIANDGQVIYGYDGDARVSKPVVWTSPDGQWGQSQVIVLPFGCGDGAISADGSVIVDYDAVTKTAYQYTSQDQWASEAGIVTSQIEGLEKVFNCSSSGEFMVGQAQGKPFLFDAWSHTLTELPGPGRPLDVSDDGLVVVGDSPTNGFNRNEPGSWVYDGQTWVKRFLPLLPRMLPQKFADTGSAIAVSDDGKIIAGNFRCRGDYYIPLIWDASGVHKLDDLLTSNGEQVDEGWYLTYLEAMSPDGKTFGGSMTDQAVGQADLNRHAWVATLQSHDPPRLETDRTLIRQAVEEGEAPVGDSFQIRNGGGGELAYTCSVDAGWMTLTPAGGSSSGEWDRVEVGYALSGLAPGLHRGTITVSSLLTPAKIIEVELLILPNLLPQGDFEAEGGWSWQKTAAFPASSIYRKGATIAKPYAGAFGLALSNLADAYPETDFIALAPGTHSLNAWMRGHLGDSTFGGWKICALLYDAAKQYKGRIVLDGQSGAWASPSWIQVGGSFDLPQDIPFVKFRLQLSVASGWVTFDDLTLDGAPLSATGHGVDGSFETDTGWTWNKSNVFPATSVLRGGSGAAQRRSGSFALCLSNLADAYPESDYLAITPGEHELKAWIQGEIPDASFGGWKIMIRAYDSAHQLLFNKTVDSMAAAPWKSTWTQAGGAFTLPNEAGFIKIRLYFSNASGWVDVDDLSLDGVPISVAQHGVDGSFETDTGWIWNKSQVFPATSIFRKNWGIAKPHAGNYGLAMSNLGDCYPESDFVALEPGTYKLSAQVRGVLDDSSWGSWSLKLFFFDENHTSLGHLSVDQQSSSLGWHTLEWVNRGGILTAPDRTKFVKVRLQLDMAQGWVAFDDIKLFQQDGAVTP